MKTESIASQLNKNRRLCVLFPGALGDFLCCLPAIEKLARGAAVDVFARSEFAAIAPDGVTIHSLERPEISMAFMLDTADSSLENFFSCYEAVYSWTGSAQPDFVRRLQAVTKGSSRVFPFRPQDVVCHQAQYYFRSVGGEAAVVPYPSIVPRDEAVAWRKEFWAHHLLHDRAVCIIAPGSGAREKNWAEDSFLAIADWWRQRTKGAVVVLLGPVEKERGISPRMRESGVIAQDLDLAQAAALLGAAAVYVGNDSGITHLAAASGVSTVALFGPSDPFQWAPRGPKVTVLSRHEECSPCTMAVMKGCSHRNCLSRLDIAQVIATIERFPEVATLTR